MNRTNCRRLYLALCLSTLTLVSAAAAQAPVLFDGSAPVVFGFEAAPADNVIPRLQLVTPEELAISLQSTKKTRPLLFQMGSHTLYAQAHIPGSEYLGAASSEAGRQQLRERVKALPNNAAIVIYCGCCPWSHCPNIHPAYQELRARSFTNVKVLYIADNFGTDWVSKGYPTAKGD